MSPPDDPAARSTLTSSPLPALALPADRIATLHGILILLLVAAHVATQVVKHFGGREFVFGIVPMFDMDAEGNVPSAVQGIALTCAALLLYYIACQEEARGRAAARRWFMLGAAFTYLAIDELSKIHEMFDFMGSGGANADIPFWIVPLGLFALGIGLYMAPLLSAVPRPTARGLVIAGATYVTGAVGVEILSQKPVAWVEFGSFPYAMQVAVEETLEMLGVLILVRTLLGYIAAHDYRAVLAARA